MISQLIHICPIVLVQAATALQHGGLLPSFMFVKMVFTAGRTAVLHSVHGWIPYITGSLAGLCTHLANPMCFFEHCLSLRIPVLCSVPAAGSLVSACPPSITSATQSCTRTSCPSASHPGSRSLHVGAQCKVGHMCATKTMSSPAMD